MFSPAVMKMASTISERAAETCSADDLRPESYYEAAITQCYFLTGVTGEEVRTRVTKKMQEYSGRLELFFAWNVVTYKLLLDDVLPSTLTKAPLPLEPLKLKQKHVDAWSSDEEYDFNVKRGRPDPSAPSMAPGSSHEAGQPAYVPARPGLGTVSYTHLRAHET